MNTSHVIWVLHIFFVLYEHCYIIYSHTIRCQPIQQFPKKKKRKKAIIHHTQKEKKKTTAMSYTTLNSFYLRYQNSFNNSY